MEVCRMCGKERMTVKSLICDECLRNIPKTFEYPLKRNYRAIFIHHCGNDHLYLSIGSNDKNCPICNHVEVYCKNCGSLLNFKTTENDSKNYFCSKDCQRQYQFKSFKKAGYCSICGVWNLSRDQNGRGKDGLTVILDTEEDGQILLGCNCSKEWFTVHNRTDNMRARSAENISKWNSSEEGKVHIKELNENKWKLSQKAGACFICRQWCGPNTRSLMGLCPSCHSLISAHYGEDNWSATEEGHAFRRGLAIEYAKPGLCTSCGKSCMKNERHPMTGICKQCYDKAIDTSIQTRKQIAQDRINSLCLGMNYDELLKLENIHGVWIDNKQALHESKNLFRSILDHYRTLDGKIDVIVGENKTHYMVNNILLQSGASIDLHIPLRAVIIVNGEMHQTDDIISYIVNNKTYLLKHVNSLQIIQGESILSLEAKRMNIRFDTNGINLDHIDQLRNIPGVWALFGTSKHDFELQSGEIVHSGDYRCLTAGQSENFGDEIKWALRVLTNKKLIDLEKNKPGSTGRWSDIQQHFHSYGFVKVNLGELDKGIREALEALYAVKNGALYWQPSITQVHMNYERVLSGTRYDLSVKVADYVQK